MHHIGLSLHACLQCLDNGGTKDAADAVDLRRRADERALEKEEEHYFNEDRYVSPLLINVGGFIQVVWSLMTFGIGLVMRRT